VRKGENVDFLKQLEMPYDEDLIRVLDDETDEVFILA